MKIYNILLMKEASILTKYSSNIINDIYNGGYRRRIQRSVAIDIVAYSAMLSMAARILA